MTNNFYISARRSNSECVCYVNNPTQGASMVPNAWSLARRFDTMESANNAISELKNLYKGLTNWTVERDWIE